MFLTVVVSGQSADPLLTPAAVADVLAVLYLISPDTHAPSNDTVNLIQHVEAEEPDFTDISKRIVTSAVCSDLQHHAIVYCALIN
jgi:hypothetical protein